MYNRETCKSRGFGFVVFEDAASVARALAHRVQQIDGKAVEVKAAVPKGEGDEASGGEGEGAAGGAPAHALVAPLAPPPAPPLAVRLAASGARDVGPVLAQAAAWGAAKSPLIERYRFEAKSQADILVPGPAHLSAPGFGVDVGMPKGVPVGMGLLSPSAAVDALPLLGGVRGSPVPHAMGGRPPVSPTPTLRAVGAPASVKLPDASLVARLHGSASSGTLAAAAAAAAAAVARRPEERSNSIAGSIGSSVLSGGDVDGTEDLVIGPPRRGGAGEGDGTLSLPAPLAGLLQVRRAHGVMHSRKRSYACPSAAR